MLNAKSTGSCAEQCLRSALYSYVAVGGGLVVRVYTAPQRGRYRVLAPPPWCQHSLLAICVGIEHRIVTMASDRECKLCGSLGPGVAQQPKFFKNCDSRSNGGDHPPATTAEPIGGIDSADPLAAMSPAGCVHHLVEEARRRKEQQRAQDHHEDESRLASAVTCFDKDPVTAHRPQGPTD
jgi:hypothetical protein